MITEQQDTARRIRAYQVDQLYTRFHLAGWLIFGSITILIIILWPVIKHWILLVWWGVMMVIYAMRLYLVSLYRRAKPSRENIEPWATRFLIGTVCAALGWGAAGIFLFSHQDVASQLLLILIIAGTASSGLSTLTSVREDIIAFLCCMLIPPIVNLAFIATKIYLIMSGLILFYLVGLLLTSWHMTNTIKELLTLRLKSMQQTEKLQESEERYRDLFENATDLIQSITPEGQFIYVNQAWKETLGYSEKEVLGISFFDIIHPEHRTHFREIIQHLSSGEKIAKIETVFVAKSGENVIAEGSVSCRFKDETPISIRGIFRDITESKQAAELLKQSESRLSGILSSMVDILFAFDKEGRFTFYHYGTKATLFLPPEQFIGKKHEEVMPPHINELFIKAFKEVSKGGVVDYEYWLDLDKAIKWFSVKLSPMFLDGEFIGAVAVVRDITDRKRAEEKIKASLTEKEVLLKEIHHRVKNNLQIISSLLSLQSGYIKDKKTVEVFKNSQERVLAMALIHEKMYQSEDLSKINFREYINSLITSLYDSYYLEPGQVDLKTQIENVTLDIETAIPLGLILNELISNSLKHAFPDHQRGELRINLKESDDEKYDYTLIIGDNGVGFPAGMEVRNSGGLGMVLVQSLVKKLKGFMDIDRKDGTIFTITFKRIE